MKRSLFAELRRRNVFSRRCFQLSASAEDLLPDASTNFLQSGPNLDGTTSILPIGKYALLAGGTVSDLFLNLAWKTLGMSKSAEHLMHARFGNGEERRVAQEWVQQGWGEHYEEMKQQSFQSAFRDIAKQRSAGAYRGTGQLAPTTQPWSAIGLFSDQHWGSGGATLSIAGSYRWYVGQSGRIDVAFEVQSRFYDDYRFRADGNLLHHSMQSLGQITPFPITGDWTERSRWTIDPNETANRAVPATELPEPPRLFP